MHDVRWKAEPDEHDYPAATDYLELLFSRDVAEELASRLRRAAPQTKKAKDLLRASGLDALGADNPHVAKDLNKVHAHTELSPVLLVRGDGRIGSPLIVADGYHRICAVHLVDEDAEIPCRLVDLA